MCTLMLHNNVYVQPIYEYLKTTLVWFSTLLHRPPQMCVAIALVTV